jgi:CRP-like cAMP-binding protein
MSSLALASVGASLESRLFEGLARRDVSVILEAAQRRHFLAGSVVVNQGHPANHLFLIARGRARFFFDTPEGRKVSLLWLTPGEIFGGKSILSKPSIYLVSTETLKDSQLLVWDRATIRNFSKHYPRLLENALQTASDYLGWYLSAHVALISHSARERLARVLTCLSETIGEKVPGGFEFEATNEELASAAHVTPFTASRLLSAWQRDHTVIKHRGKILLRFPERLLSTTM